MRKIIIAVIIVSFTLNSCLKKSGNECVFNACAFTASSAEIQTVQNYLSTNSLTATQHCSGMFYRIENPGTGPTPGPCSNVTVTYKTYFFDGTILDQSTTPVPVNLTQTIMGWRIGMPLLKTGGRIVMYIPPSIAYGNQNVTDANGNIVIPANSYLVFEVDLISVS
ncbi:MAG: FKBP-type peptidyl-prolyl cis-trans isomerase [Proteobacteria bacterium]|nr:FKBP-type peptidyl-prolyl cis-trans isomerase [Pseudomonadota bacterium]MBS1920496.1 FKBP-type peptidyl-prolyl cis-trans isomerase [Bacteroidota bacterium]MBS1931105.1 FKBP-type peptidyl-prolyl cis-trans isomerase [Bacteroidota bacterium]